MAWFKVEHRKGKKWKVVHVREFQNVRTALDATASYFQEMEIPVDQWRVKPATAEEAAKDGGHQSC